MRRARQGGKRDYFGDPASRHDIIEETAEEADLPWRQTILRPEILKLVDEAIERLDNEEHKKIAMVLPYFHTIKSFKELSLTTGLPLPGMKQKIIDSFEALANQLTGGKQANPQIEEAIAKIASGIVRSHAGFRPGYTPEQIHTLARIHAQAGFPIISKLWQTHPELSSIYTVINNRDAQGRRREPPKPPKTFLETRRPRKRGYDEERGERIFTQRIQDTEDLEAAREETESGKLFFGTGSFYEYFKKFHGILPPREVKYVDEQGIERTFTRKVWFPEELKELAAQHFERLKSLSPRVWRDDEQAVQVYRRMHEHDASGKRTTNKAERFLGHGNFKNFLRSLKPDLVTELEEKKPNFINDLQKIHDETLGGDFHEYLQNELNTRLDERERKIIIRRYGLLGNEKKTLEELATEMKIRRQRVHQIETKAKKKLAKPFL